MTNNKYSYETQLEAILLLNEGVPGREICGMLGLNSDGLIYTWRKYVRNGDIIHSYQGSHLCFMIFRIST